MLTEKHQKQIEKILALEANWDGENSPVYSRETTERALTYISKILKIMKNKLPLTLETLDVLPGPDVSIDLHWKTEKYEFLAKVPLKGPVSYYGDNYLDRKFSGTLRWLD